MNETCIYDDKTHCPIITKLNKLNNMIQVVLPRLPPYCATCKIKPTLIEISGRIDNYRY